jgi:MFS family permease
VWATGSVILAALPFFGPMKGLTALVPLAMFLSLVPVTLVVPGLAELVIEGHGGSESDAHAFMVVNMLAGILAVPLVLRWLTRVPDARWLLSLLFVTDALAFVGMAAADSLGGLYLFRLLDGAVHLPAVTLLMVISSRLSGGRRGRALGALASALMLGVTVGSPLGGWLVRVGAGYVYGVGAALFGAGAALALLFPPVPVAAAGRRSYRWDWRVAESWIPLGYAFLDRLSVGVFVSTFTLFLARVHGVDPAARGVLVSLFMVPFSLLCYPAGRLAERIGWVVPIVAGNVLFGVAFASYGILPPGLLPLAMLASGVAGAAIFAPSLVLVAELSQRGENEGLFGAFQVAGSLGFLLGPAVGGLAVELTRDPSGRPAYEAIFAAVGALALFFSVVAWVVLRRAAAGLARAPLPAAPEPQARP